MINLARVKSETGNNFDAISLITQVQQIWESILPENHPNKAYTYSIYGLILENNNQLNEALHQQEIALQMYVKLYGEKHPEVAVTHYRIGQVYQKQNAFYKALEANQNAIFANLTDQESKDIFTQLSINNYLNGDYLLTALLAKAKALEAYHFEKTLKARDLKAAIDTYSTADSLVNSIKQFRLNESDKIKLGKTSRLIYGNGIKLSLILADQPFSSKKYIERAFNFCERSKASVLLGAIQDTKAKSFSGIPSEVLSYEDSLNVEITLLQEKISSGESINENRDKLFKYQKDYQLLIGKLEREYPKYYDLKYQQKGLVISELQNQLQEDQALLQYFEGENDLYIFIVTKDKIKVELKSKNSTTQKQLVGYRNGLKYKVGNRNEETIKSLYKYLIPNIPTEISQLILIPDGFLNTIPFEALKNPKTDKYLLQEYSISYDFSASLIAQRKSQIQYLNKKTLLVAPEEFSSLDIRLSDLPGTKEEISNIKYLLASNNCQITTSLKKDATEDYFKKSDLTSFKYIHLATHGLVNESKPELSRIFLNANDIEDGFLYAGDIYNLAINADLVALSACETGLGKIGEKVKEY